MTSEDNSDKMARYTFIFMYKDTIWKKQNGTNSKQQATILMI